MLPAKEHCALCAGPIIDRFFMRVGEISCHECCLRCSICEKPLSNTCHIRLGKVYCRMDYHRIFAVKCARCLRPVLPNELVMKALDIVFHVQCFVCTICGQMLHKGDQFIVRNGHIICGYDFMKECNVLMNLTPNCSSPMLKDSDSYDELDLDGPGKGPKRPRTILTTSQRRKFKSSFEINPKPCRKVRESLAADTGLSVRVVQVWFQNQRAKMKKIARRQSAGDSSAGPDSKRGRTNFRKKQRNSSQCEGDEPDSDEEVTRLEDALIEGREKEDSDDTETLEDRSFDRDVLSPNAASERDSVSPTEYTPNRLNSSSNARQEEVGFDSVNHSDAQGIDTGAAEENLANNINDQPVGGESFFTAHPIDRLYNMQSSYFH